MTQRIDTTQGAGGNVTIPGNKWVIDVNSRQNMAPSQGGACTVTPSNPPWFIDTNPPPEFPPPNPPYYVTEGFEPQLAPEDVFTALGCTEDLTREYIRIALQDIALFDRKQHDYGPANIAAFGERGALVRANDKMARLRRLVWSDLCPANESVEDSWADLSVYGVIARLCRQGLWPEK